MLYLGWASLFICDVNFNSWDRVMIRPLYFNAEIKSLSMWPWGAFGSGCPGVAPDWKGQGIPIANNPPWNKRSTDWASETVGNF